MNRKKFDLENLELALDFAELLRKLGFVVNIFKDNDLNIIIEWEEVKGQQ
ncbi:MAG: hypothetical protein UU24_C0005G0038 [Candidatus Nomurabacteria bacterium GW2011_GWA2_40_9]|uniref:Phage protein n=1 Tax=Candidatus Nomurabacteria bacterium GW2011_GWA2_40_9 TaxID=1618734 RepID=A0A0G0W5Z1_9BACT|nr:MAG: hypothetical protein UU24_C0005G0038 [Candidatus Nomurabacteria bacterium GW2011_GWA2_40_9]